jgi:hypothetical protein
MASLEIGKVKSVMNSEDKDNREVTQLRSLTNEELWELKDDIKSIQMLLDSLIDDCFTYDLKCGWRIKRR